jgi:hypothetical protein
MVLTTEHAPGVIESGFCSNLKTAKEMEIFTKATLLRDPEKLFLTRPIGSFFLPIHQEK